MERIFLISLVMYCCSANPLILQDNMLQKIETGTCVTIKNFVNNSSSLAECKNVKNPEKMKAPTNNSQRNDLVMCMSIYSVMQQICFHNSKQGIYNNLEYKTPLNSNEFDMELKKIKPKNDDEYDALYPKMCENILFLLKKIDSSMDEKSIELPYIKDALDGIFKNEERCDRYCASKSDVIDPRCTVLLWASNLFNSTKISETALPPPVKENQEIKTVKIDNKPVKEKTPEEKPKEKPVITAPNKPSVEITLPKGSKPDAKPEAPKPVKPQSGTELKEKKTNEEVNLEKTKNVNDVNADPVDNDLGDEGEEGEEGEAPKIGGSNPEMNGPIGDASDQNAFERESANRDSTPNNKGLQPNLPHEMEDFHKSRVNAQIEKEKEESHFFTYFSVVCLLCIGLFLGYHNKQKLLAIALEGRRGSRRGRGSRRRPSTANYRKLDSNLEEAVTSQCSSNATHVIY